MNINKPVIIVRLRLDVDAKDEIKRRLSIEEVVGDYLELKRAGRNFKALSPFSSEKTPSFIVSPEKQIWHDFSSNKGGDMFSFVMEVEGFDFRSALELLARKAGVELSDYSRGDGQAAKLKKQMIAACQAAAEFYHLCLSRDELAKEYIKNKRGFSVETIRRWQLGVSPKGGSALKDYLGKRGFNDSVILKAGLVTKRRNGLSDMFIGRMMVPLRDYQGQVVGFTSRILDDSIVNAPKYMNTPQTLIYDKGRQVFGLDMAKQAIREKDFSVVVEGNLDVISLHQAGFTNTVAAAGTAITKDHLRVVGRLAPEIRLAFDTDQAGINATERAIELAQELGVVIKIVELPSKYKDPDELVSDESQLWPKVVASSKNPIEWLFERLAVQMDTTTAQGKKQITDKLAKVLSKVSDPVELEHYCNYVSGKLGVSVGAMARKVASFKQPAKLKSIKNVYDAAETNVNDQTYQDDYLALNCYYPDVRSSMDLIQEGWLNDGRRSVLKALNIIGDGDQLNDDTAASLQVDRDYVKILTLIAEEKYASWNPADLLSEAMALARRIVKNNQNNKMKLMTTAIKVAEDKGDFDEAERLLKQYQDLLKKG